MVFLFCFFRLPRGLLSPEELHLLAEDPAKVADTLSRAVGRVVASTDKSQVGSLASLLFSFSLSCPFLGTQRSIHSWRAENSCVQSGKIEEDDEEYL